MKKTLLTFLLLFSAITIFAQEPTSNSEKEIAKETKSTQNENSVVQKRAITSTRNSLFRVKTISFNKKENHQGHGEILETEFVIQNLVDLPQNLYIFVIATNEQNNKTKSSFDHPVKLKPKYRLFVPTPNDLNLFKNNEKDEFINYYKIPTNYQAGVNPLTKKPYLLKDKLVIRTKHLSKYRNDYFFFNNATILIYNDKGQIIYCQQFLLDRYRHH